MEIMVKSFQQHYSSYRLILLYKVWREIPNWLATSDKFPLYLSIAFLIILYSISSRVVASFATGSFFARGKSKSLPSNTLPSAIITAFSIVCSSSRIFPNQGCAFSFSLASGLRRMAAFPYILAYLERNISVRGTMSSGRSLSGGISTWIVLMR